MSLPSIATMPAEAELPPSEPSRLRHCSTYLVQPLSLPQPRLNARADLHKCAGSTLIACTDCTRRLAPAATVGQQWIQPPAPNVDACTRHADVSVFGHLYVTSPIHLGDQ